MDGRNTANQTVVIDGILRGYGREQIKRTQFSQPDVPPTYLYMRILCTRVVICSSVHVLMGNCNNFHMSSPMPWDLLFRVHSFDHFHIRLDKYVAIVAFKCFSGCANPVVDGHEECNNLFAKLFYQIIVIMRWSVRA